ncbi:MAG: amidophosphoribosyltransferase [Desulfobacterales bacterium]|nr:MAG: amidophosphoribosyltransferase [Desulfobacterales bacterium]
MNGKRDTTAFSCSETMASVVKGLLDLVYPPACLLCKQNTLDEKGAHLCSRCSGFVTYIKSPRCQKCGCALEPAAGLEDRICGNCLRKPPAFDSVESLVCYREPVSGLLHRLKYHGDTSVISGICELASVVTVSEQIRQCDLIIPVPLHRKRLKQRGLNQSLVLAAAIFQKEKSRIVPDLLIRKKNTKSQTGLDGAARRKNLRNVFQVKNVERIVGKRICVIDDVFTTGTTINECAKTLKKAGAKQVHAWTFSRV